MGEEILLNALYSCCLCCNPSSQHRSAMRNRMSDRISTGLRLNTGGIPPIPSPQSHDVMGEGWAIMLATMASPDYKNATSTLFPSLLLSHTRLSSATQLTFSPPKQETSPTSYIQDIYSHGRHAEEPPGVAGAFPDRV